MQDIVKAKCSASLLAGDNILLLCIVQHADATNAQHTIQWTQSKTKLNAYEFAATKSHFQQSSQPRAPDANMGTYGPRCVLGLG